MGSKKDIKIFLYKQQLLAHALPKYALYSVAKLVAGTFGEQLNLKREVIKFERITY